MKWVIARFIGTLKTKHLQTTLLRLFDITEDFKIFNFFMLPYERKSNAGDNIGLLATNSIIEQAIVLKNRSLFSFLARTFSPHPHLVDRYLNLLTFAKKEFPQQFNDYLNNYDAKTKKQLNYLLPKY